MNERVLWLIPASVVGVAAAFAAVMALPIWETDGEMGLREFGRIPVMDGGRIKPLDTVARTSLIVICARERFYDDNYKPHRAIEWLADAMASNLGNNKRAAFDHKIFRIDNLDLLTTLGLQRRYSYRYSINEFIDKIDMIDKRANQAAKKESGQRDAFDNKVMELAKHLEVYMGVAQVRNLRCIPQQSAGTWLTMAEAIEQNTDISAHEAARVFLNILDAYSNEDPSRFNESVAKHQAYVKRVAGSQIGKTGFEVFFNSFSPFWLCQWLYFAVFLLACCSWLGWTEVLTKSAFWLCVFTLVLHTFALVARMYLQGRPPVTNLYSSAIFIGWGCVVLGLTLEMFYRNSLGTTEAAATGFVTMLIAGWLSLDGDTMEVLQAVLDTNFWLATHVTSITMGYVAAFVAGFFGLVFVLRGVFTTSLHKADVKTIGQMTYGSICFGLFFSFVGTVLGGLWADYSWGRFWGWDPKENGALLIVMWNALILHARWGGMVKERGMAVLAIGGNIVTAWSWFGVNMLGVGLHAYGFKQELALLLVVVVVGSLALMGLGAIPKRYWRSFAQQPPSSVLPVVAVAAAGTSRPLPATGIRKAPGH